MIWKDTTEKMALLLSYSYISVLKKGNSSFRGYHRWDGKLSSLNDGLRNSLDTEMDE